MPDPTTITPGTQIQLTPEQIASFQPAPENISGDVGNLGPVGNSGPAPFPPGTQVKLDETQAAEFRKSTGQLDPLKDFNPEQLAALQQQTPEFDPVKQFASRPELESDPAIKQKVADAFHISRTPSDFGKQFLGIEPGAGTAENALNVAKKAWGTVFDIAKGFGKQAWNYAQGFAAPLVAGATAPFTDEGTTKAILDIGQRQIAENLAASETGIAQAGKLVDTAGQFIGRKLGIAKSLKDYTPEDKIAALDSELAANRIFSKTEAGKGPILSAVGSTVVKDLADNGVPVRPEEVSTLVAGDPFSWYAMGKAFHGAGALVPEAAGQAANRALGAVGDAAAKYGGNTVETVADVADLGARAVKFVTPAIKVGAAVVGAVKGFEHAGPFGALGGLALGEKIGEGLKSGAEHVSGAAKAVGNVGEQIAGAKPIISPVAQFGRDVLQQAPAAAADVAKGVAFDLGLAAVTSEEAPDQRAGLGIGTVFGALGAGKRVGASVLSGQIIAPREYGSGVQVPSSRLFPTFDAMNDAAMKTAAPGVITRLNAIRSFLKGANPNTDIFLGSNPAEIEQALTSAGVDAARAKEFANQNGFFTTSIPDKNGNQRGIIVVNHPDSAPHEAFHAVQDVLGESANRAIDKIVQDAYSNEWESIGTDYARRLVGPQALQGKEWREAVLDASGWGRAEAADKIAMEISNRLQGDTGTTPDAATVHDMAEAEWNRRLVEAAKRNPQVPVTELQDQIWRDILSPEEAKAVGDRYIARELAAENFDALFKHTGQTMEDPKGLLPKLSGIIGNLISATGGESLQGRVSEVGKYPLKSAVVEAVRGAKPTVEIGPAAPPIAPRAKITVTPGGGVPATPEGQQQAAEEAKTIAATAPDTAPAAKPNLPQPQSPREILGRIAEAIASRSGVKINYHSAPDEPAAATTSSRPVRRAIIEAFRTMPQAARALWEKSFFPERVLQTKKGYQVMGWAPEVFASNAHKVGQVLADLNGAVASPYEIDPKTRTFSEQGWRDLFTDTQNFVNNQVAGRTGAGEPLVVPKGTQEAGYNPPQITRGAEAPLDQRKADFINLLFNFKLPETPRITKGKVPLNIAGQAVSEATKPGRTSLPVTPRGEFTGEAAKNLGIEGASIKEVNPVRAELEQAVKAANLSMPSMIEAIQRLNVENINEVAAAPELPQFRGNTLTLTAGFQPKYAMESMKNMNMDEWINFTKSYKGKYGEGLSNWAVDQGMNARTAADLDAFKEAYSYWSDISKQAMKERDFVTMPMAASKAQAAREAFEAATGRQIDNPSVESGTLNFIRVYKDPGFRPPMEPPSDISGQFQPNTHPEAIKSAAVQDENGKLFLGSSHMAAYQAAGRPERDIMKFKEGFVTNSGEFLDRKKAFDRAVTHDQLKTKFPKTGSLNSENLTPSDKLSGKIFGLKSEDVIAPLESPKDVADKYAADGWVTKYSPPEKPVPVNENLAKHIADYYEQAKSEPGNEDVKASYDALKQETMQQYKYIVDAGYKIEPWTKGGEPYKNSAEMVADVKDNKHLFFKPTGPDEMASDNLMAEPSGVKTYTVNDIFRAVHDFFGHAMTGNQFGPKGEFNAWREHSAMFNAKAQGALAAETLAQNSWVNYGPHLRNEAGAIAKKGEPGYKGLTERPFAEQKNIVIPPEIISEAKAQFQPNEERKSRTGLEFKQFFNDVTSGKFGKSEVPFKPEQDLSDVQHVVDERNKHTANFEDHIHKSIPTLYEEKTRSIDGVLKTFAGKEARLLDIAGSEGDYGKTISALSNGKIKTVTLDPNPEMAKAFKNKSQVPGASYAEESFGFPFEDAGRTYIKHEPEQKYDVINEAAGFQFIDPDRAGQIAEVKRLLKPDGLFLTVEKLKNPDWAANEKFKDENFKNKYFSTAELKAKDTRVGFSQSKDEGKTVGMLDNMVTQEELEKVLSDNFKHVTQYWDSGNFKGYAASDDAKKVEEFVSNAGDLNSKFSTVTTPREVQFQPGAPEDEPGYYDKYNVKSKAAKSNEWTLQPAQNGFSKAWITPAGKPIQLGGQWHHDYMNEHPELGLPKSEEADIVRAAALKKGYARVNYDTRNGALTIEARAENWNKLKPSVEKFVESNLGRIDRMQVYLFNSGVTKVADSDSASFLDKKSAADKMASIPLITGSESRAQFQPKQEEQLGLGDISVKEPLSTQQLSNMTRDEIAEHFPEAVIPRKRDEAIPSNIVESPLYKEAGSEPKAVEAFAKKLAAFAKENETDPMFKAGAKWYRDFVPQLKKEFGSDAQTFAELLAATSPQTSVGVNFGYAYDALNGLKSGRFTKQIAKFEEGLNKISDDSWETWYRRYTKNPIENPSPASFLAEWIEKFNLKPKQSNGSLYGMHSVNVLRVFANKWLEQTAAPKTQNFVRNILGTGHEATIDLWADRTMRRLGYSDHKERWRILPQNGTGVADEDFNFSQKAFRAAADKLGMRPDDLQGALWFAEKKLWAENGWASLDFGSFQKEMEKIPLLKSGIESRLKMAKVAKKAPSAEAQELFPIEPRKLKQ